ncbi:MAG: hypothetical protein ACXWFP_15620 [Methylobacter sp.]
MDEAIICLLFFNLAETMACFFDVDLGSVADFFASLVAVAESFLLVGFGVMSAFLLLGLDLAPVEEFFLLSDLG